MDTYWDPERQHRVYPIDAPPDASRAERQIFRENLRRVARAANGRCPYCGKPPEPGRKRCERCLERQRRYAARSRERQRAEREAERRAAQPRRCPKCNGSDLQQREIRHSRPYYKCRACGRSSFGDGPPGPPPDYPCPYCRARCVKDGRVLVTARKPQRFKCTKCGRHNLNLWPEDPPSEGGPFPHPFLFGLNVPAEQAILVYCQEHKMTLPQAIRDIFIRAAAVPPVHPSGRSRGYAFQSPTIRAYLAAAKAAASPAPALPEIAPVAPRLPSAWPAALEKLNRHRVGGQYTPSVLVTCKVSVRLSDLALASLMEIMRRRHLNHQDAARAVIAETLPRRTPIAASAPHSDLEDGW